MVAVESASRPKNSPSESCESQMPEDIPASTTSRSERRAVIERALGLEYLTIVWNVIEGVVAVIAANAAGSVALLGFGLDSFVESASGFILVWRLRAEIRGGDSSIEWLERRATRLVGATLFLLAAYITFDSASALWLRERPDSSLVGIALVTVSLVLMYWLARAKASVAHQLNSRALHSDSIQTRACWWLSAVTLAGIGLNAGFGWWWADPGAALGVAAFVVREGVEAWRGES